MNNFECDIVSEDEASGEEDADDDESQASLREHSQLLKNTLVAILYIGVGVIFLMTLENTGFVTSLYIVTQIVTTIGYGDITVKSYGGKLFMTVYVLCGIVFVANIINDFANSKLAEQTEDLRTRLLAVRESKESGSRPTRSKFREYKIYQLVVSLAVFVIFTSSGAAFFAIYESCSCSYGKTAITGCTESNCTTTDAQQKNWGTALYMAVITLTTVGFGDLTPQSQVGRALGSVWMLFGVLATANMVQSVGATLSLYLGKGVGGRLQREAMTEKLFKNMDYDNNNEIDREEFLRFMLLRENLIARDTLAEIDALFASYDHSKTGTVSLHDLMTELRGLERAE